LREQPILSPLRLPLRHAPDEADSTDESAILEAVRSKDWQRLGVLLGVHDQDVGVVIAAWARLSPDVRRALRTLTGG
jgi:hypothetical protein